MFKIIKMFTKRFVTASWRILSSTTRRVFGQTALNGKKAAFITGGGATTTFGLLFFSGNAGKNEIKTGGTNIEAIIREADLLFNNYMIDNVWSVLKRFERTNEPELLWRLARVLTEKAKLTKDKNEKKNLFLEALEYAQKAVSNEPISGCFGAHKWYAITINYVSELEGTSAHIKRSYEVKHHLERALEINSLDATTWHILGVWHYTFANMPFYQRLTTQATFGTPPRSTYEEALRHFERAETLQPGFYKSNAYMLGEVSEKLGRNAEALKFYKKAFTGPIISVDDCEFHEKALAKLKKNGIDEKTLVAEN